MATIPLFNGFHDGLYQFLQSTSVLGEYLLNQHTYWRQLTSIWRWKWSKMRKIVNFGPLNGLNTTCGRFLWCFISILQYLEMNIYWKCTQFSINRPHFTSVQTKQGKKVRINRFCINNYFGKSNIKSLWTHLPWNV